MSEQIGYYSVIQFCPDRSRMEAMNVGLALVVPPDYVGIRLTEDFHRISAVWPHDDVGWIRQCAQSMAERIIREGISLCDPRRFDIFIASRANTIILSERRLAKIVGTPDNWLDMFFKELVLA